MEQLIHINDFCNRCGFHNSSTVVNNGFGCDHPKCDDGSHVRLTKRKSPYYTQDEHINGDLLFSLAKSMTKRNIKCNRRLAKKFIKKAKKIQFNNEALMKYGFKWQGACYTFTCPLGYEADKEDFGRFGENHELMSQGEWMVVDDKYL